MIDIILTFMFIGLYILLELKETEDLTNGQQENV